MTRFHVSTDASRDLDAIFLYWAERVGLKVADRLIDGITERFWLLGEHPEAGRPADEVAAGVRCFPAGKYLVYYRKTRRGTEILHIFHGSRERGRPFKEAAKRKADLGM